MKISEFDDAGTNVNMAFNRTPLKKYRNSGYYRVTRLT